MLNIEFQKHKGTQNYEGTMYIFYNKTFSSILDVAKLLENVSPGELIFVNYHSSCCVYDLEIESVFIKNEWIHIPKEDIKVSL